MRNLLPHKVKHYKNFALLVERTYRKLRYGISSCKAELDADLTYMRKELVDWQSNEDEDALMQSNINTTWLPVEYRHDSLVLYDPSTNAWGPGYTTRISDRGPQSIGVGYSYANGNQNIIEVNSSGCITRINLNPAITINQNSSFMYTQVNPETMWVIDHNMGLVPNVTIEDLDGNDIEGIVEVVNNNQIKLYFNQPVAGKAYLS
jgi:hypothetical protein